MQTCQHWESLPFLALEIRDLPLLAPRGTRDARHLPLLLTYDKSAITFVALSEKDEVLEHKRPFDKQQEQLSIAQKRGRECASSRR